jgi:precorrin-6B C5,15-methyltransferase / cobalt-precorrin-6B C5,C15-methyltransferase
MTSQVHIIGIGADGAGGLRPEVVGRIVTAEFLAGGERQLGYFPTAGRERFTIRDNVAELVEELRKRFPAQRCVVLASGDPLFYGIGVALVHAFGPDRVRVEPAVSTMQLAFARGGVPWQHATLATVHGRELRPTLLPLLGHTPLGLFTHDGDTPAQVAHFFLRYGLGDYEAVVAENVGAGGERVTRWPALSALVGQRFSSLNYLILRRSAPPSFERYRHLVPGVPDEAFVRPVDGPEIITRQEVRCVILGKLCGRADAGDVVWDVGAGVGTVAIEMAVLRPHVEVVAVERDPSRAAMIRQNRERFGAYNIDLLEGQAPDVLHGRAERPRAVFVGGVGGRLPGILDLAASRLEEGGRLLGAFVTLEHLLGMIQRLQTWGWPFDVCEVQVSRRDSLGGLTGLKPQRSVFLISADRPGR